MAEWEPAAYKDYKWIVADADLLGGKLAVRGTRLSVFLILECLAGGMSLEDIDRAFDRTFPHAALPEVLKVASENGNVELMEPLAEAEGSRVIVTFVPPAPSIDLRERGIDEVQASDLRRRLASFAEDWDRPEMTVYDELPPR